MSKQPLTDVTEGTVDFFKGLIDTGGQLTEQMRKTSRAIFQGMEKKKKKQ